MVLLPKILFTITTVQKPSIKFFIIFTFQYIFLALNLKLLEMWGLVTLHISWDAQFMQIIIKVIIITVNQHMLTCY